MKGNWPQMDIKSTHVNAFGCITAASRFKLATFDYAVVTFENVLSRLGVQLPSGLVPSMLFQRAHPHMSRHFGCKDKHNF